MIKKVQAQLEIAWFTTGVLGLRMLEFPRLEFPRLKSAPLEPKFEDSRW
jgi:hypothetical protein